MAHCRSRRSFLTAGALGSASAALPLTGLAEAVERTPRSSSPSDLRITGVRGGLIRGQHSLFVKVETNQGIHGCAEAVDGVYGTYYVMKHIAERHLVGKSPLNVHRLQEEMRRGGVFKGAQAGMYVCVMTALETALTETERRHESPTSYSQKSGPRIYEHPTNVTITSMMAVSGSSTQPRFIHCPPNCIQSNL